MEPHNSSRRHEAGEGETEANMPADPHADVRNVVRSMNAAWLDGRIDDLEPFFDENVVLAPPGGADRILGREAMIRSFRDYTEQATTHHFDEQEIHVDVIESVAVAVLHFSIRYEFSGQIFDETGTDLYVLTGSEGSWRIVWRTRLPSS